MPTRGPVSEAFRTTSPSGRPDDRPADPSPLPNSRSLFDGTESVLSDFVNVLLDGVTGRRRAQAFWALVVVPQREVECIGKAHKPYEFGDKVIVATPLNRCKGGGRTSKRCRAIPMTATRWQRASRDRAVDRGRAAGSLAGHQARVRASFGGGACDQAPQGEHRMGRNHLTQSKGDAINVVLAAVGYRRDVYQRRHVISSG